MVASFALIHICQAVAGAVAEIRTDFRGISDMQERLLQSVHYRLYFIVINLFMFFFSSYFQMFSF